MKITLEFENAEKFFKELPKFAALINFSGKFTSFNHVKKSDLIAVLQDPDLPKIIERDGQRLVRPTDEQCEKLTEASEEAKAMGTEAGMNKKEEAKAEATEKPKDEPKEEAEKKDAPDITEVRQVLHEAIKAGHRDEVKALLEELGAKNVSTLDPKRYADFISGAKKIGGLD